MQDILLYSHGNFHLLGKKTAHNRVVDSCVIVIHACADVFERYPVSNPGNQRTKTGAVTTPGQNLGLCYTAAPMQDGLKA